MGNDFDGKVALITGSGSGIGRATASVLASRGADVVVHDVDEAGAEQTAAEVRALGRRAQVKIADITDVAAMQDAIREAESAMGRIDVLVNNAGIASDRCTVEEITEARFDRMFGIHVRGAVFTTQAVVPGMKARRFGKIVNLSSIQAMSGYANSAMYNGAKGALLAMAKGWAAEFAPWNICVNVVAPGHTMTPMPMAADGPEVLAEKAKTIPFKRYGTAQEMGFAIAFLCSPQADFITGQVLSPNGGYTIVGI